MNSIYQILKLQASLFLIAIFLSCLGDKPSLLDGNMSFWIAVYDTTGLLDPFDSDRMTPIPGADVYAIEGGSRIANFTWVDPYYLVWLDTADWEVRPYQILVTAISGNYEQGNQLIIINLIHKPLAIQVFDSDFVNTTTGTVETDYGDTVTFDIFLQDGLNDTGILGAT